MVFFTVFGRRWKARTSLLSGALIGLGAGLIMAGSGCGPAMSVEETAPSQMPASSASQPAVPAPRIAQAPSPAEPEKLPQPTIKETLLEEQAFRIQELSVLEENGQTALRIKFSAPVAQYRHFSLTQPSRIVMDIVGDAKRQAQVESFRVETHWLSTLRLSSGEGYLRLVIEIAAASAPAYTTEPEDGGLKVIIGPVNPQLTARRDLQLVRGGKRVDVNVAEAKTTVPEPGAQPGIPQAATGAEKKYTGQPITLNFKDADIRNVFRFLAEVGQKNIIVTEDVKKSVTIRLEEPVPWDQALALLIETNNLGKEEIGNVIRISTTDQLKKESTDRAATQKAKEGEEALMTSYLNINYAKAKELETKIRPLLSPRGQVIPDERSNTILVRDIQKSIADVNALVSKLDTRTSQVLIESNLIETTPTFSRALGMELGFQVVNSDQTVTSGFPAGLPFVASPLSGLSFLFHKGRMGIFRDINSTLTAAENQGNIRIISRPSVVTLNNVPSTIQSLRILRVPLPSGTTNIASGTGSAAGSAVATEKIPVGIILTVTPQVSSDGFVLLNINVKSSSLGTQSPGAVIQDELTREAISNVLVRDGETIVIGGIMKDTAQNSEAGVPFLKDIPVFGWLFKNVRWQKDFEELVVFITPRIMAAGSENLPTAEQLWREQLKKTEGS